MSRSLLPSDCVYKVTTWNENETLMSEVRYGPFSEIGGELIKDSVVTDKALGLVSTVVKALLRAKSRLIKDLEFSMVIGPEGEPMVIKITKFETS